MFRRMNLQKFSRVLRAKRMLTALIVSVVVFTLLFPTVIVGNGTNQAAQAAPNNGCQLTWNVVPSPNVGMLYAVEAISANDVWAGGDGDLLHWDGAAWTSVSKPIAGAIRGIAAVAPNDIWAVAADGSILRWDGASWNLVTQADGGLYGITAVSANDIWAVGKAPGLNTLTVHWDGASWSIVPSPSGDLYGVAALAANDVWAVGKVEGSTLTLHWDGTSWSIIPSYPLDPPSYPSLHAVAAVAPDDVWAVGTLYGHTTLIYTLVLHWNGTKWSTVPDHSSDPSGLEGVTALSTNDAWTVGWWYVWHSSTGPTSYTTQPLIEHWDGQAWKVEFPPRLDGAGLSAIDALSSQDLWTVGASGAFPDYQSLILHGTLPCVTPTPTPTVTPTSTPCPLPAPQLSTPKDRAAVSTPRVNLEWAQVQCATFYRVLVKQDSPRGPRADRARVTTAHYQTASLTPFHSYFWRVRACSRHLHSAPDATRRAASCSDWSPWRTFTYVPSTE